MAVRANSGEARSYRLDRILSAPATQRVFVPRYPVELTPTGPPAIPDKETRSSGGGGFGGSGFGLPPPRARAQATAIVVQRSISRSVVEKETHDRTLVADFATTRPW
jgi:hypothetical protein